MHLLMKYSDNAANLCRQAYSKVQKITDHCCKMNSIKRVHHARYGDHGNTLYYDNNRNSMSLTFVSCWDSYNLLTSLTA